MAIFAFGFLRIYRIFLIAKFPRDLQRREFANGSHRVPKNFAKISSTRNFFLFYFNKKQKTHKNLFLEKRNILISNQRFLTHNTNLKIRPVARRLRLRSFATLCCSRNDYYSYCFFSFFPSPQSLDVKKPRDYLSST